MPESFQMPDWAGEKMPYTQVQKAEIAAIIKDNFLCWLIEQTAFCYVNASFPDSEKMAAKKNIKASQAVGDIEQVQRLAEFTDHESQLFSLTSQQKEAINRAIKQVNKGKQGAKELYALLCTTPNVFLFLEDKVRTALIKAMAGAQASLPIPIITARKPKDRQYPHLHRLIVALADIFEAETGTKALLATDNTKEKSERWRGPFFRYLCACVLPLNTTHNTPLELGDYASNVLKDR